MLYWEIWGELFSFSNLGFCVFLLCITGLVWQVTPAIFHTNQNIGGLTFAKASINHQSKSKTLGGSVKPAVKKELRSVHEIWIPSIGVSIWMLLILGIASFYAFLPAMLYEWLIVDVIFSQSLGIKISFNYETAIFSGALLSVLYWYSLELSACASCLMKTSESTAHT